MKLDKVENIVKRVLETYSDTRDDDFVLVYRVYKEINEGAMIRELFCEVMLNHKEYGLPAFEGITRARRKLQKDYPELRPSEMIGKFRKQQEEEYKAYSRS